MADIFISYSKIDRDLASKISAFLEAEGWTVWWDKSLTAGDSYRDEIMRQLASARAVVTVWTESSIRSDWVRAEAGRAKADGKLIPVKTPAVTYADIPLPFSEMHTESTAALNLVSAAIVAQLSRPATQPSTVWVATKAARLHLLTWVGIVGGAVTLFANARDVLILADWVRWFVTHWQDWTHALWMWVFGWIGLQIPREFVPLLSFGMFTAMLIIGTRLRDGRRGPSEGPEETQPSLRREIWRFCQLAAIYAVYFCTLIFVFVLFQDPHPKTGPLDFLFRLPFFVVPPILVAVYAAHERKQAVAFSMLYLVLSFALVFGSLRSLLLRGQIDETAPSRSAVPFLVFGLQAGLFAAICFAPLRSMNRRLLFLILGVILLAALNEISKLGLYPYIVAPKPPA